MSKVDLQTVLTLIPNLNPEERLSVKAAVTFINGGVAQSPDLSTKASSDPEICFETFRRVIQSQGIICPPWGSFKRLNIYKHFHAEYPAIETYIQAHFGRQKLAQRQRLYLIFAELLLDWMHRNNLPMKVGLFFNNLKLIPELMVRAFPGYLEQGWLPMVLLYGNRGSGA